MVAHQWIKKCVVGVIGLASVVAFGACGGQTEQRPGPYSNELLNNLSQHPPQGEPVPGSTTAGGEEPAVSQTPVEPPPSEPDVVVVDVTPAPVMDAAPEASVDAGRRRTPAAPRDGGAARPAPRRDGGR
jgi:hypothetical protein